MVIRMALPWIFAALFVNPASRAQQESGSIRGVVHDKDFAAPLPSVLVAILETGQKTTSSEQGLYTLGQVVPGRYTLVFSKDGYVKQLRPDVVVTARALTDVDVALAGDFSEMEEFVVQDVLRGAAGTESALQQLRLESPALMDSIGAELMSRAVVSDAASALRLVAGATVQDGKSAVIRGLPDRYVSSQLNGVRLPSSDDDKRAVELDQFPSEVVESVRVSKTFTPDQQGDASGGAVDVRLKGIPDEPFFVKVKGQLGTNSNVPGRGRFLTYHGGGVDALGDGASSRGVQTDRIGKSWEGAVGVARGSAGSDTKGSLAIGGRHDAGGGVEVGAFVSVFHEHEWSSFDDGVDDSMWVEDPGAGMSPKTSQGTPRDGDFKTSLFDVEQGEESVQWGGLAVAGITAGDHSLNLAWLRVRTAEDSATLAEDTRGKEYFHPGHDPDDPSTPGHDSPDAAPYLRLETLEYTERTTESLQLRGTHRLPIDDFLNFRAPELEWSLAHATADLLQPDKRQFGSLWLPGRVVGPITLPATHRGYKPSANFTLGNVQRIWKAIGETSDQIAANLKLPFDVHESGDGHLKFGLFRDRLRRGFDQDSFSNFGDNSFFEGGFDRFWSGAFPFEEHSFTASDYDVDYRGRLDVAAWYAMFDVPLLPELELVGGVRVESTELAIVNDPEANATWFPPGSLAPTRLNPGDADVAFDQEDLLPAISVVYRPIEAFTVRASYAETVARQTFKELTPILQQEFLGGPIFIGNPELEMSALANWDLRVEAEPCDGGFLSTSVFRKDIDQPIEYVQRLATFDFTSAVNYPKGELRGLELEARQSLGDLWEPLDGFTAGANATFIDARVVLPADEAAGFRLPNIRAPMDARDMTNAPDHLYNLFLTWDLEATGTQVALFWTVQGDTLVAGATQSAGNFVPSVYAEGWGTLNLSVNQRLGEYVRLQFQAKNLSDPEIRQVYRSPYIGDDVLRSSHSLGVDLAIGVGGEIRF